MKHIIVRRALLMVAAVLMMAPIACNAGKNKPKAKQAQVPPVNDKEVNWMSVDDVQVAMKKEPRKIWVDVYTGWCGWCKVMDRKTYTNPDVIRYLNQHFYAVKFDAESKDSLRFNGKMFGYIPEKNINTFALEIMKGTLSYPTSVYMDEHIQDIIPVPGYQDVPMMEMILKYLGDGTYKKMPFEEWQRNFKPSWKNIGEPVSTGGAHMLASPWTPVPNEH